MRHGAYGSETLKLSYEWTMPIPCVLALIVTLRKACDMSLAEKYA